MSGYILPACLECNMIAGTTHSRDFEARAGYVNAKLRTKYRNIINAPAWRKQSLDALGDTLKSAVVVMQNQKLGLGRRLEWNAVAYVLEIVPQPILLERRTTHGRPTTGSPRASRGA